MSLISLKNGTWFAEIPGFEGVWANSDSVAKCRYELKDVLEEWLKIEGAWELL